MSSYYLSYPYRSYWPGYLFIIIDISIILHILIIGTFLMVMDGDAIHVSTLVIIPL